MREEIMGNGRLQGEATSLSFEAAAAEVFEMAACERWKLLRDAHQSAPRGTLFRRWKDSGNALGHVQLNVAKT